MLVNYWELWRSQWVNGEREETIELFALMPVSLRQAIIQAIDTHLRRLPIGTTRSGDLTDLIEMLKLQKD